MSRYLRFALRVVLLVVLWPAASVLGQIGEASRGDVRIAPTVDSTIARIRDRWRPDLVLAGGDMVAGQDKALSDGEVRAMWAAFDDHVAGPLRDARIPFGFTIGNHDGSAASGYERDRRLAAEYWNDPAHDPQLDFVDRSHFPFHYTFTSGDVFVLVWDASSAVVQDLDWVEEALSSDAARTATMRLAVGHLPLYGVAEGRNRRGEVLENPDELRTLLEEYDVHMYVSGHHHAYYPGRRGAVQLLHAGALGGGPRRLLGTSAEPFKAVTVMDVDLGVDNVDLDARETIYTTFEPSTWRVIDMETLPEAINSINGTVVRRDLAGDDGGM